MKLKKAVLFPGLLTMLLSAAPILPVLAAPGGDNPNIPVRVQKVRGFMEQLNLSAAQKEQIRQIRQQSKSKLSTIFTEAQKNEMRQARQERRKPNLSLTENQKTQMAALRQETQQKIQAVLTPEQKQQLEQLRSQRQQLRQSKQPGTF